MEWNADFDFFCLAVRYKNVKCDFKNRINKGNNKKTPLSFELREFKFQWCIQEYSPSVSIFARADRERAPVCLLAKCEPRAAQARLWVRSRSGTDKKDDHRKGGQALEYSPPRVCPALPPPRRRAALCGRHANLIACEATRPGSDPQ